MNNNLINQENSEARFTMTFTPDEVRAIRNRLYRDYQKRLSFSGFRKGRVPYQIAEKMLGKGFLDEDIIENLIDENLAETLKYLNLKEMSQPRLEKFEFGPDGSLELTINQAIEPKIDPNEILEFLKNEELETPVLEGEALDEAVNKKKDKFQIDFAQKTETDEPVQMGDYIQVTLQGNTKDEMIPRKYYFEVGNENNIFPVEIQEEFIGKEKNNPFDVQLGEDQVTATIENIYKLDKPEINDKFIEENFFLENPEEIENLLKQTARAEYVREARLEQGKEILDKILEKYPLEFSPLYIEDIEHGLNPKLVELIDAIDSDFAKNENKIEAFLDFQKKFMMINFLADIMGSTKQESPFYTDFYLHDQTTRNLEDFDSEEDRNLRTYVSQFDTLTNFVLPDLAILPDYLKENSEHE